METAPLTLAHTHARNAALESRRANPVGASEEHDLAAAEFASAAQGTSDLEALRILNLLEQHHKRLGQLLRSSHERPVGGDVPQSARTDVATPPASAPSPSKQAPERPPSPETTAHPPTLSGGLRPSARDLSSSIASNLASARGIPSSRQKRPTPISPLVSNQHADGHNAQVDTRARSISRQSIDTDERLLSFSKQSRPPWAPPPQPETAKPDASKQAEEQIADAPFQQFYATFESLISKLSAPLAFAGLPLTTQASSSKPPAPPTQAAPKSPKAPTRATIAAPSIDYSQLISRAALRAVSGVASQYHNPSESFYVVPTTGGTISYAEIMNRAEREEARGLRHHRQTSNLSNISEDDFVDAQSTILPNRSRDSAASIGSPGRFNRRGAAMDQAKVNGKTMEELALENQALKHLSDTLSRRLHVFEMSAQTSSAALAQSIRSLHRSPITTPLLSPENSRGKSSAKGMDAAGYGAGGGAGSDEAMAKRIAELEDILLRSDARIRKKDEENAKLKDTLSKYREKWDSLKAGAKARREREREGKPSKTGEKESLGEDKDSPVKPGPSGA
ncbi:hypothetical protein A1O3_07961 [Capronia epimyces CBS 606.96]|uniref:Uncharacterized protein n=1 Tax=Capronia epimyces CBS 606.96 TaxID=1182542 RepID=W9XQR9_9EURO|nr:uncharacterized protein A1O3_07961 [Capronia epimyces CBS 606.96]EXJ79680.1 hypothetical protein A1O3_07961 [Capronia epimyces CBS 606.96]